MPTNTPPVADKALGRESLPAGSISGSRFRAQRTTHGAQAIAANWKMYKTRCETAVFFVQGVPLLGGASTDAAFENTKSILRTWRQTREKFIKQCRRWRFRLTNHSLDLVRVVMPRDLLRNKEQTRNEEYSPGHCRC